MADPVGSEPPSTQATDTSAPLPTVQAANLNPPAASDTGTYSYNPNWGGTNWLSTLGSDLSGAATSAGNWLAGPTGQNVQASIPTLATLFQAGRATTQGNALTNAISAQGRPAGNLGAGTINQLMGGPSVGGPMGANIAGVTGVAGTLTSTAGQYATGQLTPAQQQQVEQYRNAAKSQVASQFSAGNLDSSARMTSNTAIDNNAAMLAQSLVAGNMQISEGALAAVNSTFQSLVNNALNASGLGVLATSDAVRQQLANNQQVQSLLQQIFGGITKQQTTAQGGPVAQQGGQQPGTPGTLTQLLQKWLPGGGGTTPASSNPSDPTQVASNYMATSGLTAPGITDITNMPMPDFNIDTSSLDTQPSGA